MLLRVQNYEIIIILMNMRKKIFFKWLLAAAIIGFGSSRTEAQTDIKTDTLECHIVGFNVGLKIPSASMSWGTTPEGLHSTNATMASLYEAPFLEYGINAIYKYQSNWLVTLDGNLWMGEDNLSHRVERLGSVFSRDSIVISNGGYDAKVTCYNRGFSVMGGVGKIFPLNAEKNPNSGILAKANAGYMLQQTIFMINDAQAPHLTDDYALLYDHQRQGFILGESVGFWFMSNHANLLNFYVELGLQQCWSRSTRDYIIDDYLGLRGPDKNRYFDMIYTLKLCWMFPLKGKQAHDYYYF